MRRRAVGYFAFPTYPTYDSFYALLWGRDLLHLHLPDFRVYRGPTEHPLAIAFGMLCSIFGQGGARLMVLGSIASFVAAVAGMYRLGRLCFGPVVGLVAALLLLSRFFIENLAAQGYLDISYVALIVWAIVLEVERPRRGPPVFLLLAAAGLLRPDAWVLSGAYWLWCCVAGARRCAAADADARALRGACATWRWPRSRRCVWVALDAIVTGNPLYSLTRHRRAGPGTRTHAGLHQRAGLAVELRRAHRQAAGAARRRSLGIGLAVWMAPRRALVPLGGARAARRRVRRRGRRRRVGGRPLPDRRGDAAAAVLRGHRRRLGDARAAARGCAASGSSRRSCWSSTGRVSAANTLSLSSLRTTLAEHEDFHEGLAGALHSPAVQAELRRCPLLSLPDNKLIPDARWILDSVGQQDIVARSQARADAEHGDHALEERLEAGSVAVYPLGSAVFVDAIVDPGDDPAGPGAAEGLQAHLHESLLRGVWQLLSEPPHAPPRRAGGARARPRTDDGARRWAWAGLARRAARAGSRCACGASRQGLPYAYNTDEADHFVPRAVAMFEHGTLNPHYFANPPAFTYLLHFLFAHRLRRRSRRGACRSPCTREPSTRSPASPPRCSGRSRCGCSTPPARGCSGAPSACWRRRSRRSRSCPSSTPTWRSTTCPRWRPLTLSLLGTAGVLRKGRARDYLLAGVGLGLACATKYTAGIVLVPLLAASSARLLAARAGGAGGAALRGVALAGASRAGGVPDRQPVLAARLQRASTPNSCTSRRCRPKPRASSGAPKDGGLVYYLWSFTWGLGWVPALAALGGAVTCGARERRLRLAARPRARCCSSRSWGCRGATSGAGCCRSSRSLCLLAACFRRAGLARAAAGRRAVRAHASARGVALAALLVAAVLVQGLVYSVHSGVVLSRADTRNLTRAWMLAHIPAGAKIVAEPVEPEEWAQRNHARDLDRAQPLSLAPVSGAVAAHRRPLARSRPPTCRSRARELRATLHPALVDYYEREGYCWVITGSTESGRAFADPQGGAAGDRLLPGARRATAKSSTAPRPTRAAAGAGRVQLRLELRLLPARLRRPGPQMTIYRLHGGRCGAA